MEIIREQDLVIEHVRRTGPGGQHRNKRSTGVRVTHLPTGIVVMATERRSQQRNLEAAMERLQMRLEKRFARPEPRKKTKPTKSSKLHRLEGKRARSTLKNLRRPPSMGD